MTNLKCRDCGNNQTFTREDIINQTVYETRRAVVEICNEGDVQDTLDDGDTIATDYGDSDTEEYGDEITCGECESTYIIDLDEEDDEEEEKKKRYLEVLGKEE